MGGVCKGLEMLPDTAAASPSNGGSSPDQAPASKPNSSARDSMMLSTCLMAGFVALLTALD